MRNSYCLTWSNPCSGCLSFAFFIGVDQGSVSTFGFADVTGYWTDIGYIPGVGGDTDPDFVNRLPSPGVAVGWGFTALLGAGHSTEAMVVVTNATSYDKSGYVSWNKDPYSVSLGRPGGFLSGLDGPVAVPEPTAALLLSLGLVGIAAFRKRAS